MQSWCLTNSFGCKHLPLINFPLEIVIVDELHMSLRITDRLSENLIQDDRDLDCKEKLGSVAKSIDSSNSESKKNGPGNSGLWSKFQCLGNKRCQW